MAGAVALALALLGSQLLFGQEAIVFQQPAEAVNTPEAIRLSKGLFFSTFLSTTGEKSCASCHDPARGWSDGRSVSRGVNGLDGIRRASPIEDACFERAQFRDGRGDFLEGQCSQPLVAAAEMGQQNLQDVCNRLNQISYFRDQFVGVFGQQANPTNLILAIPAFERTVIHGEAPIDRRIAGQRHVWDEDTERGYTLFASAGCTNCHSGDTFSDGNFHDILGATVDRNGNRDRGRQNATKNQSDADLFKTPRLRDVAKRAPYGHSGQFRTMAEMVHYLNNPTAGVEIGPLRLDAHDEACLTLFMLTAFESYDAPFAVAPADLPIDNRASLPRMAQDQGRRRRR